RFDYSQAMQRTPHSLPTRRSSDLMGPGRLEGGHGSTPGGALMRRCEAVGCAEKHYARGLCRTHYQRVWRNGVKPKRASNPLPLRSEEHTSELQSRENLVCRPLLEK